MTSANEGSKRKGRTIKRTGLEGKGSDLPTDRTDTWERLRETPEQVHVTPTTAQTWGPWLVQLVLQEVDGRPVVGGLHLSLRLGMDFPEGGLTVRDLRKLRLGDIVDDETYKQTLGEIRSLIHMTERSDLFYAYVAQGYLRLLALGVRAPAPEIAHALDVDTRTVHAWLYRARKRELLTSPEGRGTATGVLTPKAKAMLAADAETAPTIRAKRFRNV